MIRLRGYNVKFHLDFETRSEVDIWKTGAWIYSAHSSTSGLCVAGALEKEEPRLLLDRPQFLRPNIKKTILYDYARNPEIIFMAHNAFFERSIWINIMVKKHGFPPIPLRRWRCTQAKACAYGLPKALEKAVNAMGLPERKDKVGRQIMLLMSKPLPRKKGAIVYNDDPKNFEILYEYCGQDVRAERGLDNALPDLSDIEQEIWFYDQLINTRGVHVDMSTVKNFIQILTNKTNALNQELTSLTNGRVTKGTQAASMLIYLNEGGAKMPCLDKQAVSGAIAEGRLSNKQIQILRLRQQLGKSSLAKYARLIEAVDADDILRDSYIYHGASTGRWAGNLVQLQNLDANKKKIDTDKAIDDITTYGYPAVELMYPGKIMETLASCIRGVFVPSPGKELLVSDYGAIEARIVMWLAGEEQGLKEFRDTDAGLTEDIYVLNAQRIYNNLTLTKKNNPGERQLGKQSVLGCGFGMGGPKFKVTCAGYGIDISEPEAKRIVDLYRVTYYRVKNYWYDLERTMMNAYQKPGVPSDLRNVRWIYIKERDAMFCKIPSGRILTYLRPQLEPNRFGNIGMTFMTEVNSQWVRRDTYGGLLTENVTQATARDIMAYCMPALEAAGFPILMHTHDEIVSERPSGEGRLQEMSNLMCVIPKWAVGCPIVAEGFTAMRYRKE